MAKGNVTGKQAGKCDCPFCREIEGICKKCGELKIVYDALHICKECKDEEELEQIFGED